MKKNVSNMNVLEVQQGENVVKFTFNEMCDLLQFAETCMECGDSMIVITIYPSKEEN